MLMTVYTAQYAHHHRATVKRHKSSLPVMVIALSNHQPCSTSEHVPRQNTFTSDVCKTAGFGLHPQQAWPQFSSPRLTCSITPGRSGSWCSGSSNNQLIAMCQQPQTCCGVNISFFSLVAFLLYSKQPSMVFCFVFVHQYWKYLRRASVFFFVFFFSLSSGEDVSSIVSHRHKKQITRSMITRYSDVNRRQSFRKQTVK